MALYGDLHRAKLASFFERCYSADNHAVSVIDYGCGQGIASLVLHDFFAKHNAQGHLNELILVEPSQLALNKAINYNAGRYCHIKAINKTLEALTCQDLRTQNNLTIHLFSNVLDMQHLDINTIAPKIKASCKGNNYFLSCSPDFYSGNLMQQRFINYFGVDYDYIKDRVEATRFDMWQQQVLQYTGTRYATSFEYCV